MTFSLKNNIKKINKNTTKTLDVNNYDRISISVTAQLQFA